jgi:cytoskeletal protein CcmA (bactofilin family)
LSATSTATVTNKSIDSDNNTITNIVNADIKSSAAIADTKLDTISTANKVSLSALDIDGGTDIGAALADADEIIVDDGGGGTNRRADMSRVKTYIADVTLTTAAQTNITSLGTLTALTVDNVAINGTTIGHTDDTDLMTVADGVLTVAGEVDATSLDISGDADIDGTLEADAITVNGTALNTVIAGVTVTNATNSAHVLVTDNESTNEENLITFVEDATTSTGNVGLEMDGNFSYNPSTGTVTATIFKGNIDAVDGDFDGTLEADAITVNGTALNTVIADEATALAIALG